MASKQNGNQQDSNQPESEEEVINQPIDYKALVKEIFENMPKQQTLDTDALISAIKGDNKDSKMQSHGLTQGEMKKVKTAQMTGSVKMVEANKTSRYKIPEYEQDMMHFSTEKIMYDEKGNKISKPRMHVKAVDDFIRMSKTVKEKGDTANPENAFVGLRITIFHDVRSGAETSKKTVEADPLEEMSEDQLRKKYFELYNEEALPSDSKKVLIEFIKEKM